MDNLNLHSLLPILSLIAYHEFFNYPNNYFNAPFNIAFVGTAFISLFR